MSFDAERLYDLLPAIYRIRDEQLPDRPLKSLLSVIADQIALLEENWEQRYEDHFVETCSEWVLPYIGDLVGHRPLSGAAAGISSPRAEVANTIAFRRRKGTATVLEQVARDATGWPARVVESFQLLATTQHMRAIRPGNLAFTDLRQRGLLERLDTAFDTIPHTADVRGMAGGRMRHNIPNVGVFVWRLNAYPLIDSPATQVDPRRFRFSPLGQDVPLVTRPEREDEITHLAEPINVPDPISRTVLEHDLDLYYGPGKSLAISVDGVPISRDRIEVADLSDETDGAWANMPSGEPNKIAIDPELGRFAFAEDQNDSIAVSFHYAFSADMGGGPYDRRSSIANDLQPVVAVDEENPSIQQAIDKLGGSGAVVIRNNGRYEGPLTIKDVAAKSQVQLRAANRCRPTLVLAGELLIEGNEQSVVTLEGLLILGGIRVPGGSGNRLRRLRLRHCTLVPGLRQSANGELQQTDGASLIVESPGLTVEIEKSNVGTMKIHERAHGRIIDSIVDATAPNKDAWAGPNGGAGGSLHIESSTVVGKIRTKQLELASNSILLAQRNDGDDTPSVLSERTQMGCMRFCYVPPDAVVPARYRCQPDLAIQEAVDDNDGSAEQVQRRLRPAFTSLRYGQPGYAQLSSSCPVEIRTGAEDESEMGAFRKLCQPQRDANLRERVNEYLPFGLEAEIIYVT